MRLRATSGILAVIAFAGAATIRVEASIPPSTALAFAILRDDTDIGRHSVSFRRDGDALQVDVAIEIAVRVLFVTAFRYEHYSHEVWRGGRLVALDSRTDDNGKSFIVHGRATKNGFAVDGSDGQLLAPADIVPTSYWSPATVRQSVLLATQRGRLRHVSTIRQGSERIDTPLGPIDAIHYRMSGDLRLDLWYTPAGEWVKVGFMARGEPVVYRLTEVVPGALQAAR